MMDENDELFHEELIGFEQSFTFHLIMDDIHKVNLKRFLEKIKPILLEDIEELDWELDLSESMVSPSYEIIDILKDEEAFSVRVEIIDKFNKKKTDIQTLWMEDLSCETVQKILNIFYGCEVI